MKKIVKKKHEGFTLVEMLIVIGLIALLASAVLVAVNPARQFKFARDTERRAHLATILNAIGQNMAENRGQFKCDGETAAIPSSPASIESGGVSGSFNLAPCIVPDYLATLPFDPAETSAYYEGIAEYATAYKISQDVSGHITLEAESELDPEATIKITR